MEHLLAPASSPPIKIPYVGSQEFEANILTPEYVLMYFKSYLDRTGWTRIFDNGNPEETARSLQTWLYFGCLISVFHRVSITIRTRDFVSASYSPHERLVHTTRLRHYIAEWASREGFAVGPVVRNPADLKYLRGENIKEMLNYTFLFLDLYCKKSQSMSEPHKTRMNLIELSVMALGETLCSALVAIYGYEPREMPVWGPSPILEARLKENGWCVSDSPFFPESLQRSAISATYYFGGCVCPRPRRDHSNCSITICNQYLQVIDHGTYKQKHVSTSCSCANIEIPTAAMDIVKEGAIPVLRWDENTLSVSKAGPQAMYVAMSHVWSDGLGNDKMNSLPACQLSRIQGLVNNIYAETHRASNNDEYLPTGRHENATVPFWMDTLCVPVGHEDLRKAAIRRMAEVYRGADRVLVLDSFILTLPRSAHIIEKYVRIHLSSWHHRLWTLQEGQLAPRLFFQFEDGPESFYDMSYSERHSLDVRDPTVLCSPLRLLCITELEIFYRYFEQARSDDVHGINIVTRMRSCAKYLRNRQTSKSEDEPICIATILGLDSGPLLAQKDPARRMASFYDSVRHFDPRIIFHEHPRLHQEGFGWAPRSFLRQTPDLIAMREGGLEWDDRPELATLIPGGGGLPVRWPGFEVIGLGPLNAGSWAFIRPWVGGNFGIPMQWDYGRQVPWWSYTYKLEVLPEVDEGSPRLDNAASRYAVILPIRLDPDALSGPGVTGILGSIESETPETPMMLSTDGHPASHSTAYLGLHRLPLRYVCRVRVNMPPPDTVPQGCSFAWALVCSREQEWCLR